MTVPTAGQARVVAAMALLLAQLATPALAQDQDQDQDVDCADAVTQTDMNICAAEDYDAADAALNAQWEITYPAMGDFPGAKEKLLEAQRAWLTYRDAQCAAAAAPYEGGSIQPLIHASCLADLTRARASELHMLLPDR